MTTGVSFQTRARTIDHLGRGQIADAPTAVSELWKNAFDAYASNVSLHIFDGVPEIAAIFDDGVGMSFDDVVKRWLVIGTESKIEEFDATPPDTLGLPRRPKQGEKGIGRLSVAFLAPCTILVSRKSEDEFVVVGVDWRLFENPFIGLDDIQLPVERFSSAKALLAGLPGLISTLTANLGTAGTSDRDLRLKTGWERFSRYERQQGALATTADLIRKSWTGMPLTSRHLSKWSVFEAANGHGTAMFMIELNHELGVWVQAEQEGEEVTEVKDRLRQTLTGFIDPYSQNRPVFNYDVTVHIKDKAEQIIAATDVFGLDGLHDLEHYVEGEFDERGTFSGRVVAFGQDLGIKSYVPKRPPPVRGKDRLGSFKFAIGTYEVDERRSTHGETQHAYIDAQAEKFAGIALYRDNLRVMPYGRPDADFLGMEERRSKNAGREFWAHRRTFGRIAVTRAGNSSLRDKAGREGLVDNRAFRELRILVVEFLKDAARKYFGSDSTMRREIMPGLMERKALQKEAANLAKTRRKKGLRQFLKEQSAPLDEAVQRATSLVSLAKDTLQKKDTLQATVLAARARDIKSVSEVLRPPAPPARLNELEDQWRSYRNGYQELLDRLQELAKLTAEVEGAMGAELPVDVIKKRVTEQQIAINLQLDQFSAGIDDRLTRLRSVWKDHERADRGELERQVAHVLDADITTLNLLNFLNLVDASEAEVVENLSWKYRAFLSTLDQLNEGIDLEGAYAVTEDDRSELEERLRDIQAVAQIGITVEIIGHEFETLEADVRRNLQRLPAAARATEAYEGALRAHLALADRLRFLSPLKIGGYRAREKITGLQIADYVTEFFSSIFVSHRIEFSVTQAFRDISIRDIPSRIYPVFINLVNNAIYWTSLAPTRQIKLDFVDGLAVIADTGPGVDPEDVGRLFDLFFSRRRSGRGVGLYLSRVNLGVAGHKIRLASPEDPKVLDGANFIIEFKGVSING